MPVALALALFTLCRAAAADVFACTDRDGSLRYTDIADGPACLRMLLDGNRSQPAPAALRALSAEAGRRRQTLRPVIVAAAHRHGLSEHLLEAVVAVESAYRHDAISPRGARGLTQLMPATAAELGVRNWKDPTDNLNGGARHLRYLLTRFAGDSQLALAAYNAGEGAVLRYGAAIPPYPETQAYVRAVQLRWRANEQAAARN